MQVSDEFNLQVSTALYVLLQIAAENTNKDSMSILGLTLDDCSSELFENMKKIIETGIPKVKLQYREISIDNAINESQSEYQNVDVILVQNLSKNETVS